MDFSKFSSKNQDKKNEMKKKKTQKKISAGDESSQTIIESESKQGVISQDDHEDFFHIKSTELEESDSWYRLKLKNLKICSPDL